MKFVLSILCALGSSLYAAPAAERPNIVFFLADDLGWTGLNCFGSDLYETPHLAGLARKGMKFTDRLCGLHGVLTKPGGRHVRKVSGSSSPHGFHRGAKPAVCENENSRLAEVAGARGG